LEHLREKTLRRHAGWFPKGRRVKRYVMSGGTSIRKILRLRATIRRQGRRAGRINVGKEASKAPGASGVSGASGAYAAGRNPDAIRAWGLPARRDMLIMDLIAKQFIPDPA